MALPDGDETVRRRVLRDKRGRVLRARKRFWTIRVQRRHQVATARTSAGFGGSQMADVSVIGTGAMGSALVEVLAASGTEVAVWNRTRGKAEALAGPGVRIVDSIGEALASSSLIIVSVSDHEVARSLLEDAGQEMEGGVVASTSFATPEQARAFDTVLSANGIRYLDLAIPGYPRDVRAGDGIFFISGDRAAYESHRTWFEQLGRTTFVDQRPGAAFTSEMAVVLAFLPMAVSLLQGLRICQAQDLSVESFKEMALELYPSQIRRLFERVQGQPDPVTRDVEASIDVWRQGAQEYLTYLRSMDQDTGMYQALHRLLSTASDAGHGEQDWTSIAEHTVSR
jgi:3-hydroxyisobutyrate dehydrogenase-like beta-hydroxyacid dehydrogenase